MSNLVMVAENVWNGDECVLVRFPVYVTTKPQINTHRNKLEEKLVYGSGGVFMSSSDVYMVLTSFNGYMCLSFPFGMRKFLAVVVFRNV